MSAEFVEDWEAEYNEYISSAPMLSAWTLETGERVANDFKETSMLLRKMPKGRAAPSWSLPTELFLMLLGPMRGVKEDRQAGLGHECVELKTHVFRKRMKSVLSVTRRAGVTPLAAHRTSPCLSRKKHGVGGGTTSTRMIHLPCPFWRAFYRNLKNRCRKCSWVREGGGREGAVRPPTRAN